MQLTGNLLWHRWSLCSWHLIQPKDKQSWRWSMPSRNKHRHATQLIDNSPWHRQSLCSWCLSQLKGRPKMKAALMSSKTKHRHILQVTDNLLWLRWSLCSWRLSQLRGRQSWRWPTPATMQHRPQQPTSLQQPHGRASWTGRSPRYATAKAIVLSPSMGVTIFSTTWALAIVLSSTVLFGKRSVVHFKIPPELTWVCSMTSLRSRIVVAALLMLNSLIAGYDSLAACHSSRSNRACRQAEMQGSFKPHGKPVCMLQLWRSISCNS